MFLSKGVFKLEILFPDCFSQTVLSPSSVGARERGEQGLPRFSKNRLAVTSALLQRKDKPCFWCA